ncbi:MAG TPA: 3-deoxy-manno-octulosonate cytidylyltransferase [Thermosynergistes sp.]|nr:3-deoxy-manno-octulosonate cytidylyltransferase [Thermosynergistes sp.]
MKSIAIIPARFGSTRLPGKPLLPVGGVPLVVRVAKGVSRSSKVERIVVATDDERIAAVAKLGGFEAIITPKDLHSGSDRVAYVAKELQGWDIVLNVQVDDALVGPDMIDPLVDVLKSDSSVQVALLVKEIEKKREVENPNVVKVVFRKDGRALYFSRSPVPYERNPKAPYYKHIGPYAYRRDFLLELAKCPPTPLEHAESLEMLRILEMGYEIRCVETRRDTIEVDTPEDIAALENYLAGRGDEAR